MKVKDEQDASSTLETLTSISWPCLALPRLVSPGRNRTDLLLEWSEELRSSVEHVLLTGITYSISQDECLAAVPVHCLRIVILQIRVIS